jgi:NAD(P)-dependent dehydrogenase (short-subunit alcohol dehydrogenase family)
VNSFEARRRFTDRGVLIAGGAAGIGRAAALMFAAEGARVGILDVQRERGERTAAEIGSLGGRGFFLEVDLTHPERVPGMIDEAISRLDRVDVLFNHAGIVIVQPFHETTDQQFERLMNTNVRSAFLVCRHVVRHMLERGGGSIVVTSSVSAERAFAYESIYNMTKAATLMLARSIAVEYRARNIRANAVCPAFVDTDHGRGELRDFAALGQSWDGKAMEETQGRMCKPEEVAQAVLFLASQDSSFINGAALYIDNGSSIIG